MAAWLREIVPIVVLLVAVAIVFATLPKIDLGHGPQYLARRRRNWLPLGLTYAFLYMGRYNLTVSKGAFERLIGADGGVMMGNEAFGVIFGVGTVIYGVSFVINGPLTDRLGGRFSILLGAFGAAAANLIMGLISWSLWKQGPGCETFARYFVPIFSVLYGANMYFQSFGAVAIVKVNSGWFHVRERGVFGALFGILISLGIYFAFDWGGLILTHFGLAWVFLVPAALLLAFWLIDLSWVRDKPSDAGFPDIPLGDATDGDTGPRLGPLKVFALMLRNPIIVTIACIEFCSGWLRQSIMQWFRTFASQTDATLGLASSFVDDHWGMLLCAAGILGGVVAGTISDHVFGSRRGPVAALLYAVMLVGAVVMVFTYTQPWVGWLVLVMSLAVIGVHGMLSGTASMDFGGSKNAGVAVGLIDGFVYLGTAAMSFTYAVILPQEQLDAAGQLTGPATDPANWLAWPLSMVPPAIAGLVLAWRIRGAMPKGKAAAH
ncbi:MAG TPA: MFS transporter [Candidatus Krumholzibacteria bacterium]|nr:MFS transporter [Candidatus Krumholzibacteria bacterium]HPD72006.1 MFS transporter [Candidatus Krumholzibacteria bacterium]HRY41061.1 MFS transporter [Candidatus Krumholzibacteria bacterium]